jgi:hypothetical protein
MKPHFVKVKLQDGIALLWDDEGEEFLVEMRRERAWPIMSRRARRFELREQMEREPPKSKFEPFTLVKK